MSRDTTNTTTITEAEAEARAKRAAYMRQYRKTHKTKRKPMTEEQRQRHNQYQAEYKRTHADAVERWKLNSARRAVAAADAAMAGADHHDEHHQDHQQSTEDFLSSVSMGRALLEAHGGDLSTMNDFQRRYAQMALDFEGGEHRG